MSKTENKTTSEKEIDTEYVLVTEDVGESSDENVLFKVKTLMKVNIKQSD